MNIKKTLLATTGGLVIFVAGVGIGASGDGTPEPVPTATTTVTTAPQTVTATTTRTVAPAACLQAVTNAETVNALSKEGFDLAGRALQAVATSDLAELTDVNRGLDSLKPRLQSALDRFRASSAACRDASKGGV